MPTYTGIAQVGKTAPAFSSKAVVDGRIKEMTLAQHINAGDWVMLMFIPMAWSFICPTEIVAFNARLQEFETRSCAVVFVSTDSEYVLRAWSHTAHEDGGLGGVHLPLLSDRNHKISRDYGVLIESEGVAQRAMFIVDPHGMVRHFSCNDADIGRSVDEARRLLDALVFTDEFGQGCPVDWRKGDQGIRMPAKKDGMKRHSAGRPEMTRLSSWTSNWLSQRPKTWNGPPPGGVSAGTPSSEVPPPGLGEVLFQAPSNPPTAGPGSVTSGKGSVQITNLDAVSTNWAAMTTV